MAPPIPVLPQRIHLIGIGGDGMSALAHYLIDSGFDISGSDMHSSVALSALVKRGINISAFHDVRNMKGVECVVISDAVLNNNLEVVEARLRDLPILTRAQCLGLLSQKKESIFVAGSHGKSTTSALLAHILRAWDSSTSFLLGATVGSLQDSPAQWSPGKFLVAEACEAFGNLEPLSPCHLVLTNIDDDHLQYYGSQARLDRAFLRLTQRIKLGGTLVINGDDPGIFRVLSSTIKTPLDSDADSDSVAKLDCMSSKLTAVGFGLGNDICISDYQWHDGYAHCNLVQSNQVLLHLRSPLPGVHNIYNAALAAVMGCRLGVPVELIEKAVKSFSGVDRRWKNYGPLQGITLVDDYAHHPTELDALFKTARDCFDLDLRRVLIYQPQLITRTKSLLSDTAKSLAQWDEVLLLEIDPAGEENPEQFSSSILGEMIVRYGGSVKAFEGLDDVLNRVNRYVRVGDVIIIAGAGQIRSLAPPLKNKLLNLPNESGLFKLGFDEGRGCKKILSPKNLFFTPFKWFDEFKCQFKWRSFYKRRAQNVLNLYDWHAEYYPDEVALIGSNYELTYKQLSNIATSLANNFFRAGVRRGDVVGLRLNSSLDLVASAMALTKLGAVYLPLDIKLPRQRFAMLLELASARHLVCHQKSNNSDEISGSINQILIDTSALLNFLQEQSNVLPEFELVNLTSLDLAYICFTSGTTGVPKGVPITHGALHHVVTRLIEYLAFSRCSRMLMNTGIGFDVSVAELWLGLGGGGKIVVTDESHSLLGARLADCIEELKVTHMAVTPTILRTVPNRDFSDLRVLVLAGEVCTKDLVNQWSNQSRVIFNAYGPTEAAIYTTIKRCEPGQVPTIGKPLGGVNIYIMDEQNQELMPGFVGELWIGGKGVSSGYLSGSDERLPAFFATTADGKVVDWVYRSGDLVWENPKGELCYFARKDTQIKFNGVRIDPGEIEVALRMQEGLIDSVVVLDSQSQLEQLVAFVLLTPNATLNIPSLRSSLMQSLPSPLIPSQFIAVDEIPLTLNGKIDRKLLLNQRKALTVARPFFDPGRSDMEKDLVRIWEKVLQFSPIGIYDEFYTLGGDSLKILLMQDAIELFFEIELPPGFLADLRNITNLSVKLQEFISLEISGSSKSDSRFEYSRIYNEILHVTSLWEGERNNSNSLIVSLGDESAEYDLFICLQYEKELVELHEALGSKCRVHGMRSGHLVMTYTSQNIAKLANRYCEEVLAIKSSGKIIIAGICQGGTIAHSIALRLHEYIHEYMPLVLIEQARFPKYPGRTHFYYSKESFLNPINKFHGDLSRLNEIYGDLYTFDEVMGGHGTITHKPYINEFLDKLNTQLFTTK